MTLQRDPASMLRAGSTSAAARRRWLALRDRLLSDPRFQRWAARFPLTRGIARRRALALFDLCAGFVYSQVLSASVDTGLLGELARGPRTLEQLVPALGLSTGALERLVSAACSLRLLERRDEGRYGLGIHGLSLAGNPGVTRMIEHHALFYRDLSDPTALLRGTREGSALRDFWAYAGRREGDLPAPERCVGAYSQLMASSLPLLAEDILDAYPVARHEVLLDVGGGEGGFLEAAAARAPRLRLVLFDLPGVAERARVRLAGAGLASRADVLAGDVLREDIPARADLASLIRVIHDHDDEDALSILRAVGRALRPGGALLLAEPMAGTPGAERVGDAYFGFYLFAMGQGAPRTVERLCALLQDAGFERVRALETRRPMLVRLLLARAPTVRR